MLTSLQTEFILPRFLRKADLIILQTKPNQGCGNQHHQAHFQALIRVHEIPRLTNQSIDHYASCFISCYIIFNHTSKISKDVPKFVLIRIFAGTTIMWKKITVLIVRSNQDLFPQVLGCIFMSRVQDDCALPSPRERQFKFTKWE